MCRPSVMKIHTDVSPDESSCPDFTFLVPAHPGSPGQSPGSRIMVVVVVVVVVSYKKFFGTLRILQGHSK